MKRLFKTIKQFTHLVLTILLVQGCCRPNVEVEATPGEPCEQYRYYDPKKGCVCQTGMKDFWGTCYNFTNYIYYAKFDSCHCLGEAIMYAPLKFSDEIFNYDDLRIHFKDYGRAFGLSWRSYFVKADGDSITGFNEGLPACEINGQLHTWFISGKFRNNDTIETWIKWYKPVILPFPTPKFVDSCFVLFVAPKL